MTSRGAGIKMLIFSLAMGLVFAGLAIVFSEVRFSATEPYSATFTSVSGLRPGDKVRIAGVQVGTVRDVRVEEDNLAHIDFRVESRYSLLTSTKATVRYENLVGDRYLELLEGPGATDTLTPGGAIPVSQTSPALDLDTLLGGFRPLLRALDPDEVNELSYALLNVFQGQGDTLVSLLGRSGSFTQTLADQDELIGSVISNLTATLEMLEQRDDQFSDTIGQLQRLVSDLSEDRDPIAGAVPRLAQATGNLAELFEYNRPPIQEVLAETNRTATQLDAGRDEIQWVLDNLPETYRMLTRIGSYGSFLQLYVCSVQAKFTGPEGTEIMVQLPGAQVTGRCAPS
ncbi:MCE family protein [Hoyosella subflava]|nr:MCE family protein [Hoyosella subflava]